MLGNNHTNHPICRFRASSICLASSSRSRACSSRRSASLRRATSSVGTGGWVSGAVPTIDRSTNRSTDTSIMPGPSQVAASLPQHTSTVCTHSQKPVLSMKSSIPAPTSMQAGTSRTIMPRKGRCPRVCVNVCVCVFARMIDWSIGSGCGSGCGSGGGGARYYSSAYIEQGGHDCFQSRPPRADPRKAGCWLRHLLRSRLAYVNRFIWGTRK